MLKLTDFSYYSSSYLLDLLLTGTKTYTLLHPSLRAVKSREYTEPVDSGGLHANALLAGVANSFSSIVIVTSQQ
jgi:hypothetical protein